MFDKNTQELHISQFNIEILVKQLDPEVPHHRVLKAQLESLLEKDLLEARISGDYLLDSRDILGEIKMYNSAFKSVSKSGVKYSSNSSHKKWRGDSRKFKYQQVYSFLRYLNSIEVENLQKLDLLKKLFCESVEFLNEHLLEFGIVYFSGEEFKSMENQINSLSSV